VRRALLALALLSAPAAYAGPETVRTEAANLRFSVPAIWRRVPGTSDAQAARFRLPAAPGDVADTDVVLLGRVDAKPGVADDQVERWNARFTEPDSRPAKATGAVLHRTIDGLAVTRLDVSGTYVGSGGGSVQAGVSRYRLLGAVVVADADAWVFEILGPNSTVGAARADFDALLLSLELHR
jgi:hypothetical protein